MAALAAIIVGAVVLAASAVGQPLLVEIASVGPFTRARSMFVAPSGLVFVVDQGLNTVSLVDPEAAAIVKHAGGYGWSEHAFDRPSGVVTDGLTTYIADHGNHRVQRLDRSLTVISSLFTRDSAVAPVRFGYPLDVALSGRGELHILDGENTRVVVFDASTRHVRTFGDVGSADQTLRNPVQMCLDDAGNVYVAETDRVKVFDAFGNFLRTVAETLNGIRNVSVQGSFLTMVSGDSIVVMTTNGEERLRIVASHILAQVPVRDVQDAVMRRDRLFILTSTRLYVFRIE